MNDRRRINAPTTSPLLFEGQAERPTRLTSSVSGSAYLELQQPSEHKSLISPVSTLKVSCTVNGPKPLPRSAPFSPQLVLTTHVKYTPFATRGARRGFVRDASERDLGVHLETALRGVIIADRWPKSGLQLTVTVLEAEEDGWHGEEQSHYGVGGAGFMTVLAGCITVASAAIIEAGVDCVDMVTGGVAAIVSNPAGSQLVIDPCPSEHHAIVAACVVGYLQSRDEITEVWMKGDIPDAEQLMGKAVQAANAVRTVLDASLKESTMAKFGQR